MLVGDRSMESLLHEREEGGRRYGREEIENEGGSERRE